MKGTDDRLDDGIEARLETFGLWHETRRDGVTAQDLRDLIRELRDARAEIAEAKRLLTDMNCERDHWQFAYEEAVQRAEQAESDLREAKAQHAIDENELVENTVKAHVRQMNVVAAELAAERAKVEAVAAVLCRWHPPDNVESASLADLHRQVRVALAGGASKGE